MYPFLLSLSLIATAVGVFAIGFGIPNRDFSLGDMLIIVGTVAVVGGMIMFGLAAAVRQLRRIADGMAPRQNFFRRKNQINKRRMIAAIVAGYFLAFDAELVDEPVNAATHGAVSGNPGQGHQTPGSKRRYSRSDRRDFRQHRRVELVLDDGMAEGHQGHRLFAGRVFRILAKRVGCGSNGRRSWFLAEQHYRVLGIPGGGETTKPASSTAKSFD